MPAIVIRPDSGQRTGWLVVDHEGITVASLDVADGYGSRALEMWLDGSAWLLHLASRWPERFVLSSREEDREVLLEVRQPKLLRSFLTFAWQGSDYRLKPAFLAFSSWTVETDGHAIGRIRSRGLFRVGVAVDVDDRLPLVVRVLLGWIVIVRRSRRGGVVDGG